MTFTIPVLTADDLAARAQAEIASMPTTRLTTHVPDGADRIAGHLHGRRDRFHLPEPSLAGITRSGSRRSRAAGPRAHEPVSGGIAFAGYRPTTRYHGTDRDYSLTPHLESREAPTPVVAEPRGRRSRADRIADLLTEANNLMAGAELDIRLARGVSGARREEIRTRARECFERAERLVHRAEGLARASRGSLSPELRAQLDETRLRSDTAGFAMGAA